MGILSRKTEQAKIVLTQRNKKIADDIAEFNSRFGVELRATIALLEEMASDAASEGWQNSAPAVDISGEGTLTPSFLLRLSPPEELLVRKGFVDIRVNFDGAQERAGVFVGFADERMPPKPIRIPAANFAEQLKLHVDQGLNSVFITR